MQKIQAARIEQGSSDFRNALDDAFGKNAVHVTLEDGSEHFAFRYYFDELTFTESEFVGLTLREARELFTQKDVAYLQS